MRRVAIGMAAGSGDGGCLQRNGRRRRTAEHGLHLGGIRTMPPARDTAITAPTLLLWGDQDALVPRAEQGTLLAAIPGARLLVYEGAGHSPNWEQPDRVAHDIDAVLHSAVDRDSVARAGTRRCVSTPSPPHPERTS